jgi:para-nitrobenzyl esterase
VALSEIISSYDVNFAKTGDPNGPGLPQWPAFTDQNEQVMVYEDTASARTYPLLEKAKVLDRYFERLRKEQ